MAAVSRARLVDADDGDAVARLGLVDQVVLQHNLGAARQLPRRCRLRQLLDRQVLRPGREHTVTRATYSVIHCQEVLIGGTKYESLDSRCSSLRVWLRSQELPVDADGIIAAPPSAELVVLTNVGSGRSARV